MKSLCLILFLQTALALANGSSGVGSVRVPVVDKIEIQMNAVKYKVSGHTILDAQQGREILVFENLSSQDFARQIVKYVPSRLGVVKAWEYLPDREKEKKEVNSWIVCGENKSCTKISATEQSGHDAGALIGTLVRAEK